MFIIFGGLFLTLYIRIVSIQATGEVEGQELAVQAAAKYERQRVLSADRGKIYDRNENIIAEDTLSYRLVAVISDKATGKSKTPRHVVDIAGTARALAEYLPMEEAKIYERLNKGGNTYQVEFGSAGRGISHEVKTAIEELKLPGILFVSDKKRYYPNGSFAAHLIGFAIRETNDDGTSNVVGRMGLEYIYNKQLSGEDGKYEFQADKFNYLLPNAEKVVQPAKDGDEIHLTLDKTIQNFLEDAMTRVNAQYNPQSMVGVVANPKTGEILAMTQRPTFNPDTREGLDTNWLNDVVENVIEPGSTLKTFTIAAAVDSGNWHPNATYQSGSYTLFDRTIRDHNTYGWGRITYLEGFQRSSNTAMAHQLEIMGADTLFDYLQRFGFGEKTGIDLPNEAPGVLLSTNPIEKVTTSYGQGSTVTPVQLIQGLTAVANGGKMMQPYVIDKIIDPNTGEVTFDSEPIVKGEPISEASAATVRELLKSTIYAEAGNAKKFQMEGYEVAGKTGTAQMPNANGRGYAWGKNEFLYSFLGMAPVDDPQLIMYIAVAKPKLGASEIGADPVSQVFKSVMQNSLKYLNVNPTDVAEVQTHELLDIVGQQTDDVTVSLVNDGLQPIIIGEGGEILAQYPKAGTMLVKDSVVFLKTEGAITLPTFKNWSLRNILVYKTMSKLPIEIIGEGYVESQSVSGGTTISDNSPIVVQLRTPKELYTIPPPEVEGEPEETLAE
ncbi:MAG: penicillin-binding protein [Solibacillus sp.]